MCRDRKLSRTVDARVAVSGCHAFSQPTHLFFLPACPCLSVRTYQNSPGQVNGTGNYLVLHRKSGKTLDLEFPDYIQRDSLKRTLAKIRGEW